jgi:hypothetical protein
MKLFDKKAEKTALIAILASIPGLLFVLWFKNGQLGTLELVIAGSVIIFSIGLLYLIKWYSNKN